MKQSRFAFLISLIIVSLHASAQLSSLQLEGRALWGSIAMTPSSGNINLGDYQQANNKVLLTWRMLPGDDENTAFNLWRSMGDNGVWTCVNDALKTGKKGIKATNYQHAAMTNITGDIHYRLTYADENVKGAGMNCDDYIAEYTMSKEQATQKIPYVSIPLHSTDDCSDYPDVFTYEANDCSVGDLDGDWRYA